MTWMSYGFNDRGLPTNFGSNWETLDPATGAGQISFIEAMVSIYAGSGRRLNAVHMANFPPGLTAEDFGEIRWGSNPNADGTDSLTGAGVHVTIIPIPEPATMSLLVLGGLGVLLRRRSRKA